VAVEPGEFLDRGADAARLIDNSPLRTEVRVSQHDIGKIDIGRAVTVSYATGASEAGRVCFISAAADPQTRTFRVEIRTPNAQGAIPSGISAETRIPIGEIRAHFVSTAVLSLGTDGALGVKTVGDDGTVGFESVEVVRAQTDGVWVSGLPDEARIITIGQGFVQSGDMVRVSQSESEASVPDPAAASGGPQPDLQPSDSVPADICERDPGDFSTHLVAGTDQAPASPVQSTNEPEAAASEPQQEQPGQADLSGGDAVAAVQEALNGLGFDAGPADGVLGTRTRDALQAFQQQNGLPATGNIDQPSFDRLMGAEPGTGTGERS
jgi:membrane fusion protein, multidrug efflux system